MNNEKFKSTIGFTDLLFNILVGFAFLFIIAFLLIKPEAKKKDFERRAEYIVVMEWDAGAKDDIDLYVEDPLGGIASFRHPRVNFMHLDKDDLGVRNDTTVMADGSTTTIKINREVITIRGIIPGEWVINAHYYSAYEYASANGDSKIISKSKDDYSITVRVELHRVNPYQILWVGEKKFTTKGQEETFLRWRIDKMGGILPPFTFQKKSYITPSGQVSNTNNTGAPVTSSTTGGSLQYFSQMGGTPPTSSITQDVEEEMNEAQWIENAREDSGEGP